MLYSYETNPAHCGWKVLLLLGSDQERLSRKNSGTLESGFCCCCWFCFCFVVVVSKLNLNTMLQKHTRRAGQDAGSRVSGQQSRCPCRALGCFPSRRPCPSLPNPALFSALANTSQSGFELLGKFLVALPGV